MFNRYIRIILILIVPMAVLGCSEAYFEGAIDRNWGRSFETAKYNQLVNPQAEKNLGPVVGLEGRPAEKIVGTYLEGPKPQQGCSSPKLGVLTTK